MSEDLCVTDQIALSRHRVFLLRELNRTRSMALRSAIYDQLAHFSALLCMPIPALDTIGLPEQSAEDALIPFWSALDLLDGKGEQYNHSAAPESLLAINFKDLQSRLDKHGCGLQIDSSLRRFLTESVKPKFVEANKNVASVLLKKTVRCMVFQARE
ncbi:MULTISPECIES: hypothetical protein [Pseudomonas]|uniref:Uncharacterized protein n=4 Tax=Pseudomonas TaxID=286 RepID=Q4ZLM7_PSEU2|nr:MULTISPECIES: hypothetical protein [Pseudomonas]AAY39945.1 hypothetical protein Psyr_4918 [Pseudomonas syringae pv. syringae B728a]MCH5510065.1 hypothetical protein [Pseudomonas syringae pv. syringae]MCH5638775.1 hypothetical protein [Pseudomonas syringae pv. syringae]MCH7428132.1 hypothetical protein [Pseudomonas syringae pv. syringae]MDU8618964.1 hypothetical protein [Pseudomonas syringae]